MARPGSYLFKRKGSINWWIRFQFTGRLKEKHGAKKEFSLGTPDRYEAETLAVEHIIAHRFLVLLQKVHDRSPIKHHSVEQRRYEPGKKHFTKDGEEVIATDTELLFIGDNDTIIRRESNEMVAVDIRWNESDKRELEAIGRDIPPNYFNKKDDTTFINRWIEKKGLSEYIKKDTISTWEMFRKLTKDKPLRLCKRSDGILLVKKLYDENKKSRTVEKKVGYLRAAVNVAMDEGTVKLERNPFQGVFENRDDKQRRRDFNDDEMKLIRENLHKLREQDQVLWKLLAQTGMRLNEPFQISEILFKKGIKYVHIGTKTETSRRDVPIPSDLVSVIPDRLDGFLFTENSETVGKRLRYFLRCLGISYDSAKKTGDPSKTIHSLRHRAKQQLRDMLCPEDIQLAILGHKPKAVSDTYGTGYRMEILREKIDRIGY